MNSLTDSKSTGTPSIPHQIAELLRVHLRGCDAYSKFVDGDALRALMSHDPPLVKLGQMSTRKLTLEGVRIVGELVATFEEQA